MSERKDQLDMFLDEALKSYGKVPENEGLEQRILFRVAESARFRHPVRSLILAASAALILCMASSFWFMAPKVQSRPTATDLPVQKRIEPRDVRQAPILAGKVALKTTSNFREVRKAVAAPKLARFPMPFPMTGEERALFHLATGRTKSVLKELTNLGGPITPIEITALEIKPLHSVGHEGGICCDQ